MVSPGLPVDRIISVSVTLAPSAAQAANFDTLLVVGSTDVINTEDRIISVADIGEVADAGFSESDPEYLAALLFFSQNPSPEQLYIGRWAQSATHGLLVCGILTAAQQALANWTAIDDGSFRIAIDGGGTTSLHDLDFSGETNLNGVAEVITADLVGATCTWDGEKFTFKSATTGAASSCSYLTAGVGGTALEALLKGTAVTGANPVQGIVAESAVAAVTIMDNMSTQWYGLTFASTHMVDPTDNAAITAVAAYIEADTKPHLFGITSQNTAALVSSDTTSIGHLLNALGYKRSFVQYSSSSAYAVASMFGRFCTVDFDGNSTVITLMFKQEPGVVGENLTSSQANALDLNHYNYFADFANGTTIIVNGICCGDAYIDEMQGADWYANDLQTRAYNVLYSTNKVPQTDEGNHQLATAFEASSDQAVRNGLLGPGVWTSGGFGQLKQNDFLDKGYYIYQPPITTQSPSDRAARKSVAFQIAAKLSGAIQDVDVAVTVNR